MQNIDLSNVYQIFNNDERIKFECLNNCNFYKWDKKELNMVTNIEIDHWIESKKYMAKEKVKVKVKVKFNWTIIGMSKKSFTVGVIYFNKQSHMKFFFPRG